MYAPTDYNSCAPTYSFTSCTVVLTPALQSIQPQLVADPEFYAAHKLFGGHWATPSGAAPDLESRKDVLLDFYVNEVEQRRWYGFWDYGAWVCLIALVYSPRLACVRMRATLLDFAKTIIH